MNSQVRKRVFISYSHKDEKWLSELRIYLRRLERDYDIIFWDDKKIQPGTDWKTKITAEIESCDAALLLISEAFIASDFIYKNELPPLLKRASEREKGLLIFPLLLKPSSFEFNERINRFQSLNPPEKPLSRLNENELATFLVNAVQKIKTMLDKLEPPDSQPGDLENEGVSYSNLPSIEGVPLPENLKDQRVLLFDIDGTILLKGEKLTDTNKKEILDLLEFFVGKDFHIIFISGNDYSIQKRNVLSPILGRGIAKSVTCFSDGGSRLFEYDNLQNDYNEVFEYSNSNRISDLQFDIIKEEFEMALDEFIASERHKGLSLPDITEINREYSRTGKLKFLDLIIYPLKPSFYDTSFNKLAEETDKTIDELGIQSVHQIMDKYEMSNALVIRIKGLYSDKDAETIRRELNFTLTFWDDYKNVSRPEIEKRGGEGFISQIALKPFKIDKIRTEFLSIIRKRLITRQEVRDFEVLLGGKTTIDILLKGVDKRKAIMDLITRRQFNPKNMIYFGDEFVINGNDLPVLTMEDNFRPSRIIHVGNINNTPEDLLDKKGFFIDGNGPLGTKNYLEFLRYELQASVARM